MKKEDDGKAAEAFMTAPSRAALIARGSITSKPSHVSMRGNNVRLLLVFTKRRGEHAAAIPDSKIVVEELSSSLATQCL